MVAVFILLICIAPTMRIFTNIYHSQQEIVRENKKNHLLHAVHAKFIEQLYKRQITFDDIKSGKETELRDADLEALFRHSYFKASGKLTIVGSHKRKGQTKPYAYLVKLEITMEDELAKRAKDSAPSLSESYEYFIYIDAQGAEPDHETTGEEEEESGDDDDDTDDDDTDDDQPDIQKKTSPTGTLKRPTAQIGQGKQK
jgi:hypothetical protein